MHNIKRANLLILPSNALATNITNASWRLESVSRQVVHWGGPGVRGSVRATPTMTITIISTTTTKTKQQQPNKWQQTKTHYQRHLLTTLLANLPLPLPSRTWAEERRPPTLGGSTLGSWTWFDYYLIKDNNDSKWCWVIINAGVELADCARKVEKCWKMSFGGKRVRSLERHWAALHCIGGERI